MKLATTIGFVIFFIITIGFIRYLIKLNRRAKKEQSDVDTAKLRKWDDD